MTPRPPVFLSLVVLCACSGGDTSGSDRVAGRVTEVSGTVTATRSAAGASPRAASKGDAVYADDTVTTAADSSVAIRLTHNQALWRLGSDRSQRVDDSIAWRAKKGTDDGKTGDDRTVSAGRHSKDDSAKRKPRNIKVRCDPNDPLCGIDDVAPPGGAPRVIATVESVEGGLDARTIAYAVHAKHDALRGCYDDYLERTPEGEGTMWLFVEILASGAIDGVVTSSSMPQVEGLALCVRTVTETFSFSSADSKTSVEILVEFKSPK